SVHDILFYQSRHHRDLHSFPTRRSSDLSESRSARRTTGRLRWPSGSCRLAGSRGQSSRAPTTTRGDDCGARCCPWTSIPGSTTPDRKSTRLNSSHVKISYAVFCLKKKKQ